MFADVISALTRDNWWMYGLAIVVVLFVVMLIRSDR
jgi:hypothetical protein